jgi:hypothetical protein
MGERSTDLKVLVAEGSGKESEGRRRERGATAEWWER